MNKKSIVAPEATKKIIEQTETIEMKEKEDPSSHQRKIMRSDLRKEFITLSDHVAESSLYLRNYKFNEANQVYPDVTQVKYRFVTKMYPHAKKGMLLVDEPQNESEVMMAYEKQKKLKKLGYRHIVVESNTTLYDCLNQLGEL